MSINSPQLTIPVSGQDHSMGPENAAVTLVEYGDFQCPHCKAARLVVEQLLAEMKGEVRFVFRHFPLARMHKLATRAAEAAEAAGAQGKFWEMHGILYDRQPAFEEAELAGYAESLGLDMSAYGKAMSGQVFLARIQADFRGGVRSGVNGTPTFFINGSRHNGAYAADSLGPAIEAARGAK
jgi:protein-disulfide isomerase